MDTYRLFQNSQHLTDLVCDKATARIVADMIASRDGLAIYVSGPDLEERRENHTNTPSLRARVAELEGALRATLQLVQRGAAEGAYNNIVAGPEYAERVFQKARALLERKP